MLLTVSDFQEEVHANLPSLVDELRAETGRGGREEAQAWQSSLPKLADALGDPSLQPLHLYLGGHGYLSLEYQLPAAASWCDVVMLGRGPTGPSAIIVELKHWVTRGDTPGPIEGLIQHDGNLVLHPSDQVRGYTEYCRRFHSTVQDAGAHVSGCVLFTRDYAVGAYGQVPNDQLVQDYPCFTCAEPAIREQWAPYVAHILTSADEEFAQAFVKGRYRQDRGFVRQIGEQIRSRSSGPFELLDHQRRALALVRAQLESTVLGKSKPRKQVIVIEGPPGSGKTVLAARIWSGLVTDPRLPDGAAVLTTTSTAQTSNWAKLFETEGGSRAAGGVVKRATSYVPVSTQTVGRLRKKLGKTVVSNPADWRANIQLLRDRGIPFQDGACNEQYLVSVVDEAHALINPELPEGRGQFGFAPTLGPLAWHIIRCSTVSIFLLDGRQGFRDRENTTLDDIKRWAKELHAEMPEPISLAGAQFRCAGSTDYVDWVDGLLNGSAAAELAKSARRWRGVFTLDMDDTPEALEQGLRSDAAHGRSVRLLASYAREWKTKGTAHPHSLPGTQQDFHEPYTDGHGAKRYWDKVWNFVPQNSTDYTWFIQAPEGSPMHADPLCEVGCPYVVRGFDFDCTGVLWLSDLVWRGDRWVARPEKVCDTGLNRSTSAAKKERPPGAAHEHLREQLAQAYRILLTRGIRTCRVWVEDAETRAHIRDCLGLDAD